MKVVTSEEMRLLESRAAEAGVPAESLMESAGLAVARSIAHRLDGVRSKRVVVLVGPGNNGGDGMVAARYLADWGAVVTLYMTTARRREDKFEECRERRCRVVEASEDLECWQLGSYVSLADLVLDAVLGIGAHPGLDPVLRAIFESVAEMKAHSQRPVFAALDLPTGLDADTGECDDACFPADVTLALGAPKAGLLQFPGAGRVGTLETLSIGLPEGVDYGLPLDLVDASLTGGLLPPRPADGHKGSFGNVLVVGGHRRYVGAPVLAASAAYRMGAGLVNLAAPESVSRVAATQLIEQVHAPLAESADGGIAAEAAGTAREALNAASAAVVGPGMGADESSVAFLRALLLTEPAVPTPVVLDADALNILANIYGWPSMLAVPTVLTPHPGEMGKLLGRPAHEVQVDRKGAAMASAEQWGQVVVLKGAHTVIAAPDGRVALSPFANPALATAGSGDVLAGIIGGLLAQGMERYEAAVASVYLHGAAAERWSAANGSGGMLASDLLALLPRVTEDTRAR
ncbi:MAG: NAD(P)H-hydrate dehydratase [Chloroflexi bacterium]|nr:NAD(P)H-hydrate dehydratase [Chloroflexota bacterium]